MIKPLGGTEMTIDDRPTMTALQLAREAKESNGDSYYENKPVCVRTADGGLHRVVGFDWDGDMNCFVLTGTDAPAPFDIPSEPEDGYYADRDNDVWHPVDDEDPDGRWAYGTLRRHWATLNQDHGPLKRLVPDPADSAPALPWTTGEHKDRIAVTDNHLVWVNLRPDYHTPEEAELRAALILRAVREARQS